MDDLSKFFPGLAAPSAAPQQAAEEPPKNDDLSQFFPGMSGGGGGGGGNASPSPSQLPHPSPMAPPAQMLQVCVASTAHHETTPHVAAQH
jgi:hypothetical protein